MKRSRVLTGIIPLAICLPCLIPLLIAMGIGAGAFSGIGAWLSSNGLVLGAAATAALAFVAVATIVYARKAKAAACDSDVQKAAYAHIGSPALARNRRAKITGSARQE